MLASWAVTATADRQLNRVGRPLTKNALLGLNAPDDVGNSLKEQWNAATPSTSAPFVAAIEKGLALYDGLDGVCGNQWLANHDAPPVTRYRALATLLADDRLWIDAASARCSQFFAAELASVLGDSALHQDCGGRTPNYNAANIWRSLLVTGGVRGIDDGLERDEHEPSSSEFPFLSAPDVHGIDHYSKATVEPEYKE
jgi:hypothetical protein